MKNALIALVVFVFLCTGSSCKKWYTCTCSMSGTITWEGEVEATSKSKAESIVSEDCNSFSNSVSCD